MGWRIWLNPPYTTALVSAFTSRLVEHYQAGAVPEAVVILNNATDTLWFHSFAAASSAICLIEGRVAFWRADNREHSTAIQGQLVVYFGEGVDEFRLVFSEFGLVFQQARSVGYGTTIHAVAIEAQ